MEYLAKSNPRETLEEHTLKLIENYDLLRQYYPGISVDWEILLEAVKYHDIGKIKYQNALPTIICLQPPHQGQPPISSRSRSSSFPFH